MHSLDHTSHTPCTRARPLPAHGRPPPGAPQIKPSSTWDPALGQMAGSHIALRELSSSERLKMRESSTGWQEGSPEASDADEAGEQPVLPVLRRGGSMGGSRGSPRKAPERLAAGVTE